MENEKIKPRWQQEVSFPWYIILYKLSLGLIEFTSGIGIIFLGRKALALYQVYLARELYEDPHDLLARLTSRVIPSLFTHNTYLVIYLLLLGSAKIAGATGLIFHRNWGVDLLVSLTALLLPFQLVDIILHPSPVKFLYIFAGLLIALYLIDFRPRAWAAGIIDYLKTPVT